LRSDNVSLHTLRDGAQRHIRELDLRQAKRIPNLKQQRQDRISLVILRQSLLAKFG